MDAFGAFHHSILDTGQMGVLFRISAQYISQPKKWLKLSLQPFTVLHIQLPALLYTKELNSCSDLTQLLFRSSFSYKLPQILTSGSSYSIIIHKVSDPTSPPGMLRSCVMYHQ